MFFGTPHSGADPRGLFHHVLEKFVRIAAGVSVNDQIVNALLPTSERLRELRDEFNPMAEEQRWKIYSFQEVNGLRALGNKQVGFFWDSISDAFADSRFRSSTTRLRISVWLPSKQPNTSTETIWAYVNLPMPRTRNI